MATNQFMQKVERVEFVPGVVKPGDLVVYLREKPFGSGKMIKYYGIVSLVCRDELLIHSKCDTDKYGEPRNFLLRANTENILAIYPNGEVFKYGD